MQLFLLVLTLLCAAAIPAAADAPFSPMANVPDYVVTMVEHTVHSDEEPTRTVRHHGDWTRIDRTVGARSSTEYSSAKGATEISASGDGSSIHILRGGEPSRFTDNEPHNTGERETFLGESCTVWNVRRVVDPVRTGFNLRQMSCITADGIELWNRTFGSSGSLSSYEATRIERRSVEPNEVEPPRSLLALDWWNRDDAAPGPTPDYESVLRFDNSDTIRQRTTRVHRAWTWVEDSIHGMRRSLNITNQAVGLSISVMTDDRGAPQRLDISKSSPPPPDAPPPMPRGPKDLGRGETVLREACRWFDMTPGMMDAGRNACRTGDGIALKEELWSRSTRQMWSAVRLTRRPVSLQEIAPPAALLDPKIWGIP